MKALCLPCNADWRDSVQAPLPVTGMTLVMPVRGAVLAPIRWSKKVSFGAVSDIQEVSFKERNKAILGAL